MPGVKQSDALYLEQRRESRRVLVWDTDSFAIQGSSSLPTASNQDPPVRERARSVTSSILDVCAPALADFRDDHTLSHSATCRAQTRRTASR
ncbi:hypothetical protein BV22DRAFT_850106 [Leucogyrophana mollusca]|uniref:Uncharacterized protein n=1 Tax=Leucogyrophana mollusca TaxID=85980 RepID=A0ACB8B3B6_9AGAM|nr:hypothetical protein BV22DRAFT_850106 [Leucogyrophana mollusca]